MSAAAELRRLVGQTLIYGLGTVFLRALAFLMLPVYTRHLSKHDYGIVALANAVGGVLVLLFPLSLHGALNRLHTDAGNERDRREVVGTLSISVMVAAGVMALALEGVGSLWGSRVFQALPYDPSLRMVVWTAFFTSLGFVPSTLLQLQGRPLAYAAVAALPALATIGFVLWEVVVKSGGAAGYLRGCLWGAAAGSLPSLVISLAHGGLSLRAELFAKAMKYCLPLVLQGVAAWVLTLSDRFILNRFVPLDRVGLYAVAGQIAGIVTIAGWAMNSAWVPHLFQVATRDGADSRVPLARLATYFAAAGTWVALGVALGGRDLIVLLSAPGYRDAAVVIPVLAASLWLGMLYLVPAGFLFLKSRTGIIPMLTGVAGSLSIGLNWILVPRLGYVGAAWGTLAGQALHLVLVWRVAQRVFPVPYEYGRLVRVVLAGFAIFLLGRLIPAEPWGLTLAARVLACAAFPVALAALGFLKPDERAALGRRFGPMEESGPA